MCMVNASLSQGRLPEYQKHAVVSPLLKKRGLDTSNMGNFRPVSNLTFMSKVVESTDLYLNNLDTGLASLSVANGDPFKLTSPAQHALHG